VGKVHGEVEKDDDGVLVVRRIHVVYELQAGEEHRDTIERVHGLHAGFCPVYKTLYKSIDMTTEVVLKN